MNLGQIKDIIIAHFYALGVVNDREEVIDIEFGYKNLYNNEDLIPIIIKLAPKEVKIRK